LWDNFKLSRFIATKDRQKMIEDMTIPATLCRRRTRNNEIPSQKQPASTNMTPARTTRKRAPRQERHENGRHDKNYGLPWHYWYLVGQSK